MSHGLSKSRIISHRQCPKRLWLQVHRPDLIDHTSEQATVQAGNTVGAIAQTLVPGGVLIDTSDLREALRQTVRALAAKPRRPVFEATVQHQGVLVQADVLIPQSRGWRMVEIKSSTKVKPYQREDAAIQSWVLRQAGVPLVGEGIAHLNTEFVYPGRKQYHGLLIESIESQAVAALRPEVPQWIDAARKTLQCKTEPNIAPGRQCADPFPCPYQTHCIAPIEGYPVSTLYRGGRLIDALHAEGYTDLRKVPLKRLERPVHRRMAQAARSSQALISPELPKILRNLPYPRYYIDFETCNPGIPLWPGTRPYQQIPFQWSCHIETAPGQLEHREFLAKGRPDPRPEFLRTLLDVLGSKGSVLVWNQSFEKTMLKNLAEFEPKAEKRIGNVLSRMIDLMAIFQEHYYHRDMHGSWSIKKVLPTIAPELSYDNLEIGEGAAASQAFIDILLQEIPENLVESRRQALLEYCERDTLAMVKMMDKFK